MGKLYRRLKLLSPINESKKEHIMNTVLAISLSRARQLIPFHVFQFSDVNSNNAIKLAVEFAKLCFTVLHSSVFIKVRDLVEEIKYGFALHSAKQTILTA